MKGGANSGFIVFLVLQHLQHCANSVPPWCDTSWCRSGQGTPTSATQGLVSSQSQSWHSLHPSVLFISLYYLMPTGFFHNPLLQYLLGFQCWTSLGKKSWIYTPKSIHVPPAHLQGQVNRLSMCPGTFVTPTARHYSQILHKCGFVLSMSPFNGSFSHEEQCAEYLVSRLCYVHCFFHLSTISERQKSSKALQDH